MLAQSHAATEGRPHVLFFREEELTNSYAPARVEVPRAEACNPVVLFPPLEVRLQLREHSLLLEPEREETEVGAGKCPWDLHVHARQSSNNAAKIDLTIACT